MRFDPPETLRIWNLTDPVKFTVKLAVLRVLDDVVTVDPTFDQVEPPLVERQSSHVLVPSLPYFACLIETVPALEMSKFIPTVPVLRTRAEYEPALRSLEVLPVSASSRCQLPLPSVTSPAAYADLPPASKPSYKIVAASEPAVKKTNAHRAVSATIPA